jgi:hypothetical protein
VHSNVHATKRDNDISYPLGYKVILKYSTFTSSTMNRGVPQLTQTGRFNICEKFKLSARVCHQAALAMSKHPLAHPLTTKEYVFETRSANGSTHTADAGDLDST